MKKISTVLTVQLLVFNIIVAHAQVVSTFAGSGLRGSTDAIGTAASFNYPKAVAVDVDGNVYVADNGNNKIRKISPTKVVSTFAGSGLNGSYDDLGTAASFNSPLGIAVDAAGNVYVADTFNHKIRKISPAGEVTTFAGNGSTGSTDGMGTAASFSYPYSIAVDGGGNLYVSDGHNHKIRKISPAGAVTTFAGSGAAGSTNGIGTAARFNFPYGIAVDGSGNVYVCDSGNNKIRKISPAGAVTTFAGSGTAGSVDGIGTAASFNNPSGITVDQSSNLYVTDYGNQKVRKISPTGEVSSYVGNGAVGNTDGIGTGASFNYPTDVAVDGSGNLYVADANNHKIRKVSETVLPVTLTGFTAKTVGNYTQLQWQTASEVNNKGFEIWREAERQEGGGQEGFVKIGEVSALATHNMQPTTYTFTDKNPLRGANYYKLVQIDNDGTTKTYGPITIKSNLQLTDLKIYTTDKGVGVTLNILKAEETLFSVYNLNGKKLFSKTKFLDEGQNQVFMEYPLAKGVYLLQLNGKTLDRRTKFIR